MSDPIQELKRKKSELESIGRRLDQDLGKREQVLTQLKNQFGVDTIDEAKQLLEELEKERDRIESDAEILNKKIEEKIQSCSG